MRNDLHAQVLPDEHAHMQQAKDIPASTQPARSPITSACRLFASEAAEAEQQVRHLDGGREVALTRQQHRLGWRGIEF